MWAIGYNLGSTHPNLFGIGAGGLGAVITIDNTGLTTISGHINITGNITSSLSTTVATLTTAASKNKCFQYTLYDSGITTNYRIGTLHLPQNGNRAVIKINICCGYNITTSAYYSNSYRIQNYGLSIHIYSGNGGLNGQQVVGSARAFDPGSTRGDANTYAIGIFL